MKKKLRSQNGASLIFALFLFLICAVIGSIVLTAGTAASGRLSEISAMDQRYYAVTSAAEVLAKELDGTCVEIVREKTETEKITYKDDGTTESTTNITYTTNRVDPTINPSLPLKDRMLPLSWGLTDSSWPSFSYLTEQTVRFLFGATPPTGFDDKTQGAWDASFAKNVTLPVQFYFLDVTVSAELTDEDKENLNEKLDVNIQSSMDMNGTIHLMVSNSDASDRIYTVQVTLVPEVLETIQTVGPDITYDGNGIPNSIVTKTIKTDTVTWNLQGIA